MTNEEAKGILEALNKRDSAWGTPEEKLTDAVNRAIGALEYRTPKKPKAIMSNAVLYCPTCSALVDWRDRYCPNCGQALDWSEVEE